MNAYSDLVTADRRLRTLHILTQVPDYALNDSVLCDELGRFGHGVSRDRVRTDLDWLAEQGLVSLERLAETVSVATITERGIDVGAGRARCDGVKRPGPADRF